jgi:formylglycine-generating enzyme required for sulfatase activity
MAGNVSEWVASSYDPNSYDYSSTINPNVNDKNNMRKVIRGGSWKDVAYFLQVSTRDYEYADSARSYIGFRTVQDYMGTDVVLNEQFGDGR